MNRKARIYPPFVVTVIVALSFAAAAVASVAAEAEEQRQQQADPHPPTIVLPRPESLPELKPTPKIHPAPESTCEDSYSWDDEDAEMLMKIAMAEAEGESVEGKALVMLVVLNRVQSDQFPDSIEETIFQKNQFSPVAEGGRYWTTEPNEECAEALALVESGWDESGGALYFESTGLDGWHSRNLQFLFEFGGHKFYL